MMETILCPTRGGVDSKENQEKAIEIAKERQAKLLFLYVSNIDFVLNLSSPIISRKIQDDLDEMGEFLLTMALERAENENVKAEILVKRGAFSQVLKEVILDYHIKTVVMGSPADKEGYLTDEYLEKLVQVLQDAAELEVIILKSGKEHLYFGGKKHSVD